MNNICPECRNTFVQPFVCTTCGAQKLYDNTVKSQQQTIDALRAALTARDEVLESIRVYAQDCIENGHDRGSLGNLYSIRDLCDRLAKGETK